MLSDSLFSRHDECIFAFYCQNKNNDSKVLLVTIK